MHYFKLSILLLGLLLVNVACDPDDPEPVNEEELITTLQYTLTPDGGGNEVVLSFQDLDGDGGDDPVIMNVTLSANTTYSGTLDLLNESEMPAESITEEIEEEDEEHQFFFQTTDLNATITYTDSDNDGNPVGLSTQLVTGEATSGQLTVILRHEPDKNGDGVSQGDLTNAGGETDIEVTFEVDIQ